MLQAALDQIIGWLLAIVQNVVADRAGASGLKQLPQSGFCAATPRPHAGRPYWPFGLLGALASPVIRSSHNCLPP
jgi:MYXO-CTERM domain-containing protein